MTVEPIGKCAMKNTNNAPNSLVSAKYPDKSRNTTVSHDVVWQGKITPRINTKQTANDSKANTRYIASRKQKEESVGRAVRNKEKLL